MPYKSGGRLPGELASKLGHLSVVQSPWVKSLIDDFEGAPRQSDGEFYSIWYDATDIGQNQLKSIWSVDGSYVAVRSEQKPYKEVAFVKTALLMLDKTKIDAIDKDLPHPLLLRDVLKDTGVQHATVFPLSNIVTSLGTNFETVRNIIKDSLAVDQDGAFYETLKWLSYQKWDSSSLRRSPGFNCPYCQQLIDSGFEHDADEGSCPYCDKSLYLTDMLGFHLDMEEDSAPESLASSYMLVMEHLMLFTPIRMMWHHQDKSLVSQALFIKDGPLTLRSQYSKLVPNIRSFFEYSREVNRIVHVIGQEKSGAFFDHLSSIVRLVSPQIRGGSPTFAPLTHDFVRREVHRTPELKSSYGSRTNWGEKVYVKFDPGSYLVLNVPVGAYVPEGGRPVVSDLIGFDRIMGSLPGLVSHKFEGALYPIELANGIASMSSYPSATILKRFLDAS
ncbi:hypothetical protein [Pseudomonas mosselii]|uniref:hypothetical protein n=1 Tax=Pseudomonas mosselii TaxID=78327 RepID=UPI001F220AC1|nr:hypothetical protein [Pseudomonas mosselii]